jgi:tetratricopeptide (TPR) repeat protein
MILPECSLPGASGHSVSLMPHRGFVAWLCLLPLIFNVAGCAVLPQMAFDKAALPPLELDGQLYFPEDVSAELRPRDILATTAEMREFAVLHTTGNNYSRTRLMSLHWAVKSKGMLGMHYDPFAEGTARQAFERGSANCLSYAHMFIALAREVGLDARYQWMEVRPEWHRMGERVMVRLHVNVLVRMRDGSEYTVDIDPLNRTQVAGTRRMSDAEGLALYYNNIAMNALGDERPVDAWRYLVRGLETAPGLSPLWVNLGAIYRYSGQYLAAEQAYFRALDLDKRDRSAINNLVVLYEIQDRIDERDYWLDQLRHYRDQNPYFHANLGDKAMEDGRWDDAYAHYARARSLYPDDGELVYSLGLAEYRRGNQAEAERLILKAIEKAAYTVVKDQYRLQLRSIREEQAAAL